MGRLFKPDEGIDLDVCDDCGFVEDPKSDVDIYMDGDNPDLVLCEKCLKERGLDICSKCEFFHPDEEIKQHGDDGWWCDVCREEEFD